jgi:hypothetical protein
MAVDDRRSRSGNVGQGLHDALGHVHPGEQRPVARPFRVAKIAAVGAVGRERENVDLRGPVRRAQATFQPALVPVQQRQHLVLVSLKGGHGIERHVDEDRDGVPGAVRRIGQSFTSGA